jgi:hypothetical protein
MTWFFHRGSAASSRKEAPQLFMSIVAGNARTTTATLQPVEHGEPQKGERSILAEGSIAGDILTNPRRSRPLHYGHRLRGQQ